MSTLQAATPSTITRWSAILSWMKRHPLAAYFILAYALTWVLVIPIMLSQRGLGIFNLPDGLLFAMLLLSTFSGPLPAALIMTSVIDGRVGRQQLLRRMFQWRVGFGWYLLVLVGYPLIFFGGPDCLLRRCAMGRLGPELVAALHLLSTGRRRWNHLSQPW